MTYAMLLARLSGAVKLDPVDAAKTLDKNNGLLARTLELLGQAEARQELSVRSTAATLARSAGPVRLPEVETGPLALFFEDFLAAYDPKLRKDYGVYYTPREVVELQVRLASELLEKSFGKKLGFADDGVVFLDPAVGTGTYPVAAVKLGLERVAKRSGRRPFPHGRSRWPRTCTASRYLSGRIPSLICGSRRRSKAQLTAQRDRANPKRSSTATQHLFGRYTRESKLSTLWRP